jgi:beta-glucanase (GH16 family)
MLAAASLMCYAVIADRAIGQIPDVSGWHLFWHDEFDGATLNTTNWTALNRQDSYNNEKQYYLPSQAAVANGNLQITATNQAIANKLYRSGLITSNALYGPGRFEARIDLPTTQGMWPAFWLNPNQVQWPLGGEIDILENKGSQPTIVSSAFHWQKDPGPCCGAHLFTSKIYTAASGGNPVNFTAGFHTYAVEWDKNQTSNANEIRYYVDDNLFFTVTQNSSMSDANFTTAKNIILNLAVGGDFGGDPNGTTVFPQTMLVDYVRVWHRPTAMPGDYNADHQVDASDYLAWRKANGQSAIGVSADGSGNGTVGPEDYDLWRQNFGGTLGIGAATAAALSIPEPSLAVPAVIGVMLVYAHRQRPPVSRSLHQAIAPPAKSR